MATNVNAAFRSFIENTVDLDPAVTKRARASRNWLRDQVAGFDDDGISFPRLVPRFNINFGSFARRTKKRVLDDIDMMFGLHGDGSTYLDLFDRLVIDVGDHSSSALKRLRHDDSNYLNSRKVVNAFVTKLRDVPQYKNSDSKRSGEAATLNLKSYDWRFDIVPCFQTSADYNDRTYFLIPDGAGDWKRTDPRLDRARATRVNGNHDGNILKLIRVMKYWNRRATMPSMSSYLLENMILDFYEYRKFGTASQYTDMNVIDVLGDIETQVYSDVPDPKGIQGDINKLSWEEKNKISDRARLDHQRAVTARAYEADGFQKKAVNEWRSIFGDQFPTYG